MSLHVYILIGGIIQPSKFLLLLLDIDLKKAAKIFAQKYSCGSSVTGPDEIVIQGDVLDDLLDFIPEKWPEVIMFPDITLLK